MKSSNFLKLFLLAALALVATYALAETNKGSFSLDRTVTLNGQQLAAGDYKVQWEGSGPSVKLSILQGKKVVATAPAQVVAVPTPEHGNGVALNHNSDGSATVTQIQFDGRKYLLQIGEQTAMQGGSQ